MGHVYLIPTTLGDSELESVLPANLKSVILSINCFIVENLRTARRFLKKIDSNIDIDQLTFFELNKHTNPNELHQFLKPATQGINTGIISEAGCPGVADPGADIVKIAHEKKLRVIPLVGPSSILLALMASGLNGQNFAFNGYLPIRATEKNRQIKALEERMMKENQTQLFIEAPYRNLQLLNDLLKICLPQTMLCIATDITLETEFIESHPIVYWKKHIPDIQKRPTIFLIGKS